MRRKISSSGVPPIVAGSVRFAGGGTLEVFRFRAVAASGFAVTFGAPPAEHDGAALERRRPIRQLLDELSSRRQLR
jgi:hypothetical protein